MDTSNPYFLDVVVAALAVISIAFLAAVLAFKNWRG